MPSAPESKLAQPPPPPPPCGEEVEVGGREVEGGAGVVSQGAEVSIATGASVVPMDQAEKRNMKVMCALKIIFWPNDSLQITQV